ncbi:retinoblastoma-like protein 1 isoform X2 [Prorops nasuta]|uniref:retinoblastoma-like protein 1 isoform X2 n=1 Tax=Prorops nasuta TaxID=863751 RepID=UPI0034CE17E2
MGQSENTEDSIYNRHQDLCQKLNMDAAAASEAWKSYETIRQNYTLEGDQLHWIGCALYVACRKSSIPTVGRTGTSVEGNCVSLTRLLQLCNLPLIQFFAKSKSWADMANMPQDFRTKIEKLEGNFSVSMIIFKKYQPIFTNIFKDPIDDVSKPSRSRRHKAIPCTPARVFEFCWTLFVCIKKVFPNISDDLVNSYHLLLACCDFMYSNALLANRKDLLNPTFAGLPSNFGDENYVPPQTANCILSLLCDNHEGIPVEAKVIKEYYLKTHIQKLFNERILRGDASSFSGILEAIYFDGNNKAVNKAYEEHVLSAGDFDERIFLGPDANENIGSPAQLTNINDLQEQCSTKKDRYEGLQHLAPPTPLTGRKYLRAKDLSNITPVSSATQSVIKLQAMLASHNSPSESLLKLFNSCSKNVQKLIETKIKTLGEQFCAQYNQPVDSAECSTPNFAKQRLLLGQELFYMLLELILNDEKTKKPNTDFTSLLTKEIFIQCLFACCLEIIVYSYKVNDKMFPWILNCLNLEPYYFYKVIEIIVRAEDQLCRDVVKHLNQIEEKILESLAWKTGSPLWAAIESVEGGVPSCEEVSLPGTFDTVDPNIPGQPVLRKHVLDRSNNFQDIQQSPVSSASERFHSPVASGIVKRLFTDTRTSGQSVLRAPQSALSIKVENIINMPDQGALSKAVTTSSTLLPPALSSIGSKELSKPKRTGSLALFFRKFYHLAYIRMQYLCNSLGIIEIEEQKKIWTIFEYSIKDRTELMKDRHLDQILMCAAYVICKLGKMEKNSFTEIMRCYRLQPQAESHIYRSVLISKNSLCSKAAESKIDGNNETDINEDNTTPPTPTRMAGTSQNFGQEERGDLIKFYNTVYVPRVKEVANRLGLTKGNSMNLKLSPLPKGKPSTPIRRVTSSIMTRTLDPKAITASPAPQLCYCFSRSPAKDLEAINRMMISVDARKSVGKRLLSDDTDVNITSDSPTKKTKPTFVTRKLENIIGDRRTQNQ